MIGEFTVRALYWAIAPNFGRCLKVVVVCHPGPLSWPANKNRTPLLLSSVTLRQSLTGWMAANNGACHKQIQ